MRVKEMKSAIKVGYVSKFPPEKDGGAIYADNLCDNLPCEVVRIGDIGSETADYRINFRSFFLKEKLAEIAVKEKLGLIHIQYVLGGQYFGKYSLKLGLVRAVGQKIPVILTFTEVHTQCDGVRGKILCWLQEKLANKAAASIAHTPKQAEFMRRYKAPSYHIDMGLILRKMKPRKGRNVLFFGMLNYGKGAEYLIEAMDDLPGYALVVAGIAITKSYEELLRKKAAAAKNSNVELDIRWVPEDVKARYLNEADIMAFPYVWAPYQSGAMHDALSYGKPAVVSKVGGVWEIIEKYNAGVVVPPRDAAAIADGIKKAVKNYAKYQAGIRKYQKEANWKEVGKKHVKAYEEVLEMAAKQNF